MLCVHTSNQYKVGDKESADRKTHRKPSNGISTMEKDMSDKIDILINHDENSDE